MKRFFTATNLVIIAIAFFLGLAISHYEDSHGILTVAERQIEEAPLPAVSASVDTDGKININTATVEELDSLHGIGEKLAQGIIAYREDNGSFKLCEDIMKVSGISKSVFRGIENEICVN